MFKTVIVFVYNLIFLEIVLYLCSEEMEGITQGIELLSDKSKLIWWSKVSKQILSMTYINMSSLRVNYFSAIALRAIQIEFSIAWLKFK